MPFLKSKGKGKKGSKKKKIKLNVDPDEKYKEALYNANTDLYVPLPVRERQRKERRQRVELAIASFDTRGHGLSKDNYTDHSANTNRRIYRGVSELEQQRGRSASSQPEGQPSTGAGVGSSTEGSAGAGAPLAQVAAQKLPLILQVLRLHATAQQIELIKAMTAIENRHRIDPATIDTVNNSNTTIASEYNYQKGGGGAGKAFTQLDYDLLVDALEEVLRTRVLDYNAQLLPNPHPDPLLQLSDPAATRASMSLAGAGAADATDFKNIRLKSVLYSLDEAVVERLFTKIWRETGKRYTEDAVAQMQKDMGKASSKKGDAVLVRCIEADDLRRYVDLSAHSSADGGAKDVEQQQQDGGGGGGDAADNMTEGKKGASAPRLSRATRDCSDFVFPVEELEELLFACAETGTGTIREDVFLTAMTED